MGSSEHSTLLGMGAKQHSYLGGAPSQYGASGYSGLGGMSTQDDIKPANYKLQGQADRHNTISHDNHHMDENDPNMT